MSRIVDQRSVVSLDHIGKLSGNSRQPVKALYACIFACFGEGFWGRVGGGISM